MPDLMEKMHFEDTPQVDIVCHPASPNAFCQPSWAGNMFQWAASIHWPNSQQFISVLSKSRENYKLIWSKLAFETKQYTKNIKKGNIWAKYDNFLALELFYINCRTINFAIDILGKNWVT